MRICRITIDVAYEDSAKDAPKSERRLRNLLDTTLDPVLGEYLTCTSGVLVKQIDFPDIPAGQPDRMTDWLAFAEKQLALLDIERYAVTHAVSEPVPISRSARKKIGAKR